MNLQEKSFTELQALFEVIFKQWKENILQAERIKQKECEKYSDFVVNRTDLRRLAKENARLHDLIVRIDLELQIRAWTGKND